jgi:hypothetical protein
MNTARRAVPDGTARPIKSATQRTALAPAGNRLSRADGRAAASFFEG